MRGNDDSARVPASNKESTVSFYLSSEYQYPRYPHLAHRFLLLEISWGDCEGGWFGRLSSDRDDRGSFH